MIRFYPIRALFIVLAAAFCLSGCAAWEKQKKTDEEEAKGKSKLPSMTDPMQDPNFQAFLGRLRKAVAAKDYQVIASMMVPDFGYRWDNPPAGDNVFAYWDQNGIWPELSAVINGQFVPFKVSGGETYMVAPPPGSYQGYRAGIRLINGSWKFAYFVPMEGAPGI